LPGFGEYLYCKNDAIYVYLCVDRVFEGTLGTHVKDGLPFISRPKLHSVESHFRVTALWALLLDDGALVRHCHLFILLDLLELVPAARYEGVLFEDGGGLLLAAD
jgi:hypothetical protein